MVADNIVVMALSAKYCLGVKDGSTGNTIRGNVLVPSANGQSIQMTADSLTGTIFTDATPARYSLDDGSTTVDVVGLRARSRRSRSLRRSGSGDGFDTAGRDARRNRSDRAPADLFRDGPDDPGVASTTCGLYPDKSGIYLNYRGQSEKYLAGSHLRTATAEVGTSEIPAADRGPVRVQAALREREVDRRPGGPSPERPSTRTRRCYGMRARRPPLR